jgi:RNA polymerase sigma-70 factor (ECF subfamily)
MKKDARKNSPSHTSGYSLAIQEFPEADPNFLESLLADQRAEVFRYASRIATDQDCAEDLTQRAFLALLERGTGWRSREEIRAFLFHVVKKRVLKAARRREVRMRLEGRTREMLYQRPSAVDDCLVKDRRSAFVRQALEDLPPRRRQALILARLEGLSHEEIGQMMNLAPQTVSNHISLALRDLKKAVEKLRSGQREGQVPGCGTFSPAMRR